MKSPELLTGDNPENSPKSKSNDESEALPCLLSANDTEKEEPEYTSHSWSEIMLFRACADEVPLGWNGFKKKPLFSSPKRCGWINVANM